MEELISENVVLYPNPVLDNLRVDWQVMVTEGTLTITNMLGEAVLQQVLHNTSAATVATNSLASGVYHLSVQATGKSYRAKFVKAE